MTFAVRTLSPIPLYFLQLCIGPTLYVFWLFIFPLAFVNITEQVHDVYNRLQTHCQVYMLMLTTVDFC